MLALETRLREARGARTGAARVGASLPASEQQRLRHIAFWVAGLQGGVAVQLDGFITDFHTAC
jgi:hypothetical protein